MGLAAVLGNGDGRRGALEVAHLIELDCTSPERLLYDTGAVAFNSTLLDPPCSAGFVHPLVLVLGYDFFCAPSPRKASILHNKPLFFALGFYI